MNQRVASCQSCNADIIWFKNFATGRSMPINAETVEIGDTELDLSHMVSHFSTCPQADAWRQKNRNKKL